MSLTQEEYTAVAKKIKSAIQKLCSGDALDPRDADWLNTATKRILGDFTEK